MQMSRSAQPYGAQNDAARIAANLQVIRYY
jgi:hypothetical protein